MIRDVCGRGDRVSYIHSTISGVNGSCFGSIGHRHQLTLLTTWFLIFISCFLGVDWGFSVKQGKGQSRVKVPVVRLSSWLTDEIEDRLLPDRVFGRYSSGPKVVMKLDVEGSEYVVVPDLVSSGALCKNVDLMLGETHHHMVPWNFSADSMGRGGIDLPNRRSAEQYLKPILELFGHLRGGFCRTSFKYLDDESYLNDGQPIPDSP